jgi:nicotinamide-nucleotide amidase
MIIGVAHSGESDGGKAGNAKAFGLGDAVDAYAAAGGAQNGQAACRAQLDSESAVLPGRCDALAAGILTRCQSNNVKIAAAESLTGGLLADAFVRVPGSSAVFLGSAVTYDIAAKASILGVDADLLRHKGAVHPEVARQMAQATANLYRQPGYDAVVGLSTTGVAGPGPDHDKPAGLVYIGLAIPAVISASGGPRIVAYELHCQGSREEVRRQSVLGILVKLSELIANSQE